MTRARFNHLQHGGVEEIKDTLQCLVGFDPRLIQTLTACCFSGIEHIPPSVLSLWTDSTSSPPRVLSASGCWPSGQPGFQETWSATTRLARKGNTCPVFRNLIERWILKNVTPDIRVYERGELKGDPTAAYCQLAQPDHRNPIYIIGAMPAALIARYPFHVSEVNSSRLLLHSWNNRSPSMSHRRFLSSRFISVGTSEQ